VRRWDSLAGVQPRCRRARHPAGRCPAFSPAQDNRNQVRRGRRFVNRTRRQLQEQWQILAAGPPRAAPGLACPAAAARQCPVLAPGEEATRHERPGVCPRLEILRRHRPRLSVGADWCGGLQVSATAPDVIVCLLPDHPHCNGVLTRSAPSGCGLISVRRLDPDKKPERTAAMKRDVAREPAFPPRPPENVAASPGRRGILPVFTVLPAPDDLHVDKVEDVEAPCDHARSRAGGCLLPSIAPVGLRGSTAFTGGGSMTLAAGRPGRDDQPGGAGGSLRNPAFELRTFTRAGSRPPRGGGCCTTPDPRGFAAAKAVGLSLAVALPGPAAGPHAWHRVLLPDNSDPADR